MTWRRTTLIALATMGVVAAWATGPSAAASISPAITARTPAPREHDDDVWAWQPLPDGTTKVTQWYPAAGVTGDELRASLRAKGVQGVLPAAVPGDTNNDRCFPETNGSRANCRLKWSYGNYQDPQVYFLDHTSAAWPVTDARADWWQAPGIDAYYRWYTAGCPVGVHCVPVANVAGPPDWFGKTDGVLDGSGHWIESTVHIELNDNTTTGGYAMHRAVACHEMGHALGLAHNIVPNSCMHVDSTPQVQHPSSDDFTNLTKIYWERPGT